jgi:L-rhamnose mutarotase
MKLHAWTLRLKPGREAEYDRRHREIWPELLDALRDAGISRYVIFRDELRLFGCFETEDAAATRAKLDASPVNQRWRAFMAPLFEDDPARDMGPARQLHRVWEFGPTP